MFKGQNNLVLSRNGVKTDFKLYDPKCLSEVELNRIAQDIAILFSEAFFRKQEVTWQIPKIKNRLREADLVIIAYKGYDSINKQLLGYGIFEVIPHTKTDSVLFIDSIAFVQQGKGLGGLLITELAERFGFRFISERTQNPAAIKMLHRVNPRYILPLDRTYHSTSDDHALLHTLRTKVHELRNTEIDERGLCVGVYTEGKLGLFEIHFNDSRIVEIERKLELLGLRRDRGDAIVVTAVK